MTENIPQADLRPHLEMLDETASNMARIRIQDAARSMGISFDDMAEAFRKIAEQAALMTEAADEAFAEVTRAPKNLPHDPTLRRDRRKWGGK